MQPTIDLTSPATISRKITAADNCMLLTEILNINDQAIAANFGVLDYDLITAWQYDLRLLEEVCIADVLLIESRNSVAGGVLRVRVRVKRRSADGWEPVAIGSFTFGMRSNMSN